MMRVLLPFLALYRRHSVLMSLGIFLAIVAIVASITLLSVSSWFLSATALAGSAGLYTFNYMLPAATVRGSAIIRTLGRYVERIVSHDATFRVLSHLRVFTFSKLLPLSPAGIARFHRAELLNRLVADVDTLDHLYLRVISPLVSATLVIILVTVSLSYFDAQLAITLGGIMLLLLLTLPLGFYRAGKPVGITLTQLRANYREQLVSGLHGYAELMIYGQLPHFRQQLDNTEQHWQTQQKKQADLGAFSPSLMVLASGLTFTLLLWLAAGGVGGNLHSGALIALFAFTSMAAFEALVPVSAAFQHLGQVTASAQRISQIINQQPAVSFPLQGAPVDNQVTLDIDKISFHYPQQTQTVINTLSLHLGAGEKVALLGRTGCGKSTLLQLITRAWECTSGTIRINQQPLDQFDEATLRQTVCVVSQRVHIFSATLRDNLLIADDNATDDQLHQVLNQVGLVKLLAKNGLDNWLGDGGRPLSGGEQRRLGIARALLYPAPLLLLDEPTEGLDAETDKQIMALLLNHCHNKTMLLITHRLHGLDQMDKICVMDAGHIIEQGSHQQLLLQQGRYFQFHQRIA